MDSNTVLLFHISVDAEQPKKRLVSNQPYALGPWQMLEKPTH